MVVSKECLGPLVRMTSIFAYRASLSLQKSGNTTTNNTNKTEIGADGKSPNNLKPNPIKSPENSTPFK